MYFSSPIRLKKSIHVFSTDIHAVQIVIGSFKMYETITYHFSREMKVCLCYMYQLVTH